MAEQGNQVEETTVRNDLGFYARMLPKKETPVEAFGGVLNGLGAGLGIMAIFFWPLLFGALALTFGGASLIAIGDRSTQSSFGKGFAIAVLGWLIGMTVAVVRKSALTP